MEIVFRIEFKFVVVDGIQVFWIGSKIHRIVLHNIVTKYIESNQNILNRIQNIEYYQNISNRLKIFRMESKYIENNQNKSNQIKIFRVESKYFKFNPSKSNKTKKKSIEFKHIECLQNLYGSKYQLIHINQLQIYLN